MVSFKVGNNWLLGSALSLEIFEFFCLMVLVLFLTLGRNCHSRNILNVFWLLVRMEATVGSKFFRRLSCRFLPLGDSSLSGVYVGDIVVVFLMGYDASVITGLRTAC